MAMRRKQGSEPGLTPISPAPETPGGAPATLDLAGGLVQATREVRLQRISAERAEHAMIESSLQG
jgi:hypothetical protein